MLPEWVSRQLTQRFSLRSLRAPSRQLSAPAGGQVAAAAECGASGSDRQPDSLKDSLPGSETGAAALAIAAHEQQQQPQQRDEWQASTELQVVVSLPSGRLPSGAVGSTGSTGSFSSQKQQQEAQEAGGALAAAALALPLGQPGDAAAPSAQPRSVARERLWLAWSFFRQYYLQAACIVPAVALVVTCITPLRNLLVPDQVGPPPTHTHPPQPPSRMHARACSAACRAHVPCLITPHSRPPRASKRASLRADQRASEWLCAEAVLSGPHPAPPPTPLRPTPCRPLRWAS